MSVGLEPDRRRALADLRGLELFEAAWNANEFAIDGIANLADLADPREAEGYAQAEDVVIAGLEQRGIYEPGRWVLDRVARRVRADSPLPLAPVTDDFVVFTFDHDLGDELLESIRFAAPPDVAAALERKGLLPESTDGDWCFEDE